MWCGSSYQDSRSCCQLQIYSVGSFARDAPSFLDDCLQPFFARGHEGCTEHHRNLGYLKR
ncbi:hypothetical protein FQN60_005685, partial [Etheostoma spectabile]